MSSYDRDSDYGGSDTPDIIIEDEMTLTMEDDDESGKRGGFNLADELAAAEDFEHEDEEEGHLVPNQNRLSFQSDYEGSEYGDIDEDSDGYLSDHVDLNELQLSELVKEFCGNSHHGIIGKFIEKLRNMRGTINMENNVRRLITMQQSLASSIDYHLRVLRDVPVLSPLLIQDDSFLALLTTLSLPPPIPLPPLLDSSFDLTSLSDTLAMTRQDQLHLSRKLRTVKDTWMERRDDYDIMNTRINWLAEHDSFDRRAPGSCAREVRHVVDGFDKVLGGVERQLYLSL